MSLEADTSVGMSGTTGLFRRFLSLAGPKVITTVLAVLSTPIITRLLGASGYGDYAVLLSIYSLAMIPVSAAITEGIQKFVAENRDEDAWIEQVIQFYLVLALVLVAIGGAILVAVTWLGFADQLFGDSFSVYLYVLAVYMFIGQFRGFSMHAILGFGFEHIKGPLGVFKKVATVGVGIGLVVSGFGVVGMLLGHMVAEAIVAAVAGYYILRRVSLKKLFQLPDRVPYREFLSFNVLNVVLVLFVMSLFHVDVVMVRSIVDDEATGYYKAALALAEYIWIIPIVLQTLLLHSTSTLWSEGRTERITELAGRITRYCTLLVALMAIGLAALAHRFVPLYYGSEFAVATTPLLLLLPGAVGFAVARPLQAICQASGELRTMILAIGVAAGTNVVLNAILIPLYGMNGAAVATSTSYGSMFLLLVWSSRTIGYDPLFDFRLARITATVTITAAPTVAAGLLLPNNIVAFLVVPVLGTAVFSVAAVGTGAVSVEETTELLGKLPLPIGPTTASN